MFVILKLNQETKEVEENGFEIKNRKWQPRLQRVSGRDKKIERLIVGVLTKIGLHLVMI
jgi:hypothetical protein